MIWLRSAAVILGSLLGSGAATAESRPLLERSIGRVLLASDAYPLGRLKVSEAIDREYKTVRRLPVEQRVRFFWTVLMNVPLDAGYSLDLVELIARDCGREFEQEITAFLKRDWEGGPPQPQADIAKRTLTSLQLLRARKAAQQ
jgi:hypothetical protein